MAMTGLILSILAIVIVCVVVFPAASVAMKSKLPFPVKVYDGVFNSPLLVVAVTAISWLVIPVIYGATVITGFSLSILVIVTVCVGVFPRASVAMKSKLLFPVKVCHVAFSIPSFVLAVTATSWLVIPVVYGAILIIGPSLSILVIVTVCVVVFPRASVAMKSKLPFPVKVYEDVFNTPLFVVAVTVISWFVMPVIYGAILITGLSLSMLVIVTVCIVVLPARSVAMKSKLPFPVKVCHVAFSLPSFVLAVTVTSWFIRPVE